MLACISLSLEAETIFCPIPVLYYGFGNYSQFIQIPAADSVWLIFQYLVPLKLKVIACVQNGAQ